MTRLSFLIFALIACFITACANSDKKALEGIYIKQRTQIVSAYATPDTWAAAVKKASEDSSERNALLNNIILLIDVNYDNQEKNLYGRKSWTDFTGSIAILGLNAVGATTGGTELKTAMNAVSGVIEGTHAAVDRDLLHNQGVLALAARMRADRATRLIALRAGMSKPKISDYPLSEGFVDLVAYYNAGTVTSALQAIIDSAGAKKAEADKVLDTQIRKIPTL